MKDETTSLTLGRRGKLGRIFLEVPPTRGEAYTKISSFYFILHPLSFILL